MTAPEGVTLTFSSLLTDAVKPVVNRVCEFVFVFVCVCTGIGCPCVLSLDCSFEEKAYYVDQHQHMCRFAPDILIMMGA